MDSYTVVAVTMSDFGDWKSGFVEWTENDSAYLSVIFSWQLPLAYMRAVWLKAEGYKVKAGGPAVSLNPDYLREVAEIGEEANALPHHGPNATFTSRGCVHNCPFCAVPIIEGELVELRDWKVAPIVCDNNLLTCSRKHFDSVIDRLKPLKNVDFNQGLDNRLLTYYHAHRLAELDIKVIRLAWDNVKMESVFLSAFEQLRNAGFPTSKIRAYVLIGFNDTPEDALYRLQTIKDLGAWPNPMRYQPLNALRRNEYVAPNWTERQLRDYCRYWSRLAWLEHIPFEEYQKHGQKDFCHRASTQYLSLHARGHQ